MNCAKTDEPIEMQLVCRFVLVMCQTLCWILVEICHRTGHFLRGDIGISCFLLNGIANGH